MVVGVPRDEFRHHGPPTPLSRIGKSTFAFITQSCNIISCWNLGRVSETAFVILLRAGARHGDPRNGQLTDTRYSCYHQEMRRQLTNTSPEDTKRQVDLLGIPDLSELGEYEDSPLAELTLKMRKFVEGWIALQGEHGSLKAAALYAGYAPDTCCVRGALLIRDPRVLAAIKYLAEKRAHASAFAAMSTLEDLMRSAPPAQRLKAAQSVLAFSGIIVKTVHEHEINIKDNRSEDQIKAAIQEKLKSLGMAPDVIDVTPKKDDGRANSETRPAGMNQGPPTYKRYLVPNRLPTEEELEDGIDWMRMEV